MIEHWSLVNVSVLAEQIGGPWVLELVNNLVQNLVGKTKKEFVNVWERRADPLKPAELRFKTMLPFVVNVLD